MIKTVKFLSHGFGNFDGKRKIGPAKWTHFDLLFIHYGHVTISIEKHDEVKLTGPSAILIFPETFFFGYSTSPVSRASIQHFHLSDRAGLDYPFKLLRNKKKGYEVFDNNDHCREVEPIVFKAISLASESLDEFTYDMRFSFLSAVIGELFYRKMKSGNNKPVITNSFTSLLEWLNKNLERKIHLKEMASRINISKSHFRALFVRQIGCSPGKYLLILKMNEAAKLLKETSLPIKKIGQMTGYDDISHFYRAFFSYFKDTPGDFRKTNKIIG